jgi:predicted Ser/Thr protein kinase
MSCPRCNAPADDETLREFGGVCPKCLLDFSEEQDAPAFPNLEIVEMLGQGGMGVVYKAVQKNLGRTVALKVLSPHLSADPEFVERFTREARALASLSHPNIVGIYDSGIHDHVPYLVMEYVDGTPLRKLLASKKLSPQQVLEVIPQICDALHYAHANGVVHRDIKPENILVDRQGRVRIADFGLAKLASIEETRITKTGIVMGSPHYMAPEQFVHSGRVDHRADIYSLGVVFYEMLTGEVPMGRFKAPSEKAAVDQRLDPVVLKSLEREPDDRWQSVDEVKARVTKLELPSPEATLVWNGIPIQVVCVLNPRALYGSTGTTVFVDGRKFGSGSGVWVDRISGSFRDRDGRDHLLEVRVTMGLVSYACTVSVDRAIVWEGSIAVQNSGLGLAMLGLSIGGGVAVMAAGAQSLGLLFVVIPAFVLAVVALVRRGLPKPRVAEAPARPATDPGELWRTRFATAFISCIALLAIAVIFWLLNTRRSDATGGPVLVIVTGVIMMALAATQFRFIKGKAANISPSSRRRQSVVTGVAGAAIVLIAVAILLFAVAPVPVPPQAVASPGKPAVRIITPAGALPPEDAAEAGRFLLADAWPAEESIPRELEVQTVDAKQASEELGLDPECRKDVLELRRWRIHVRSGGDSESHRCILSGIQFADPSERLRWQKSVRRPNVFSDYSAGATMFWLEYNRSYGLGTDFSELDRLLRENVRAAAEREPARRK